MADPVSWYLIERGWDVIDRDGEKVGTVEETVGDSSHDIFDGLSIATSLLGRPRYVPAERVAEIIEGRVHLDLSRSDVEQLGEHEEPPTSAEIEAEQAGLRTREEARVEAPVRRHPEHENLLRRIWVRLIRRP